MNVITENRNNWLNLPAADSCAEEPDLPQLLQVFAEDIWAETDQSVKTCSREQTSEITEIFITIWVLSRLIRLRCS